MEHRQQTQKAVLIGNFENLRAGNHVAGQVAVRQNGSLGLARGAGSVQNKSLVFRAGAGTGGFSVVGGFFYLFPKLLHKRFVLRGLGNGVGGKNIF